MILSGRLLLGLGLVVLWEVLHRWLGPGVIAGLYDISLRIVEITRDGRLFRHGGVTLYESFAGLAIGGSLGLALPFLLRLSPRAEHALSPFIGAAMGVPKLALAPLVILWFGIGLASKIAFVAAVVFFLIFFSTMAGLHATEPRLLAIARLMGAGRWLLLREILFPSAVPYVLASLKIAAPRALSAAVVGEFVASDAGLGFYIRDAMDQADTIGIFAGVVVVTVVTVIVNEGLERLQRAALGWREVGLGGF
ncbi:MAG: ABC transporter permease [Burkholderiales bacterium]